MSVDAIQSRVDQLESRVTALEDERAIRALIARGLSNADMGRAEAFLALHTDDGSIDGSSRVWQGRDELTELIGRVIQGGGGRTLHALGGLVIRIDGDSAVAEGYSIALRRQDQTFEIISGSANRWDLIRQDNQWRIQHHVARSPGSDQYASVHSA